MAIGNGNPGISKLARVISGRSQKFAESIEDDLKVEFGTIQRNKSLQTDSFPIAIPKGEYTVLRHVGGYSFNTDGSNSHSHTVHLPKIKPGDRVLVAWVNSEPVVLDVIVSSKKI